MQHINNLGSARGSHYESRHKGGRMQQALIRAVPIACADMFRDFACLRRWSQYRAMANTDRTITNIIY